MLHFIINFTCSVFQKKRKLLFIIYIIPPQYHDTATVVEILPRIRPGHTYFTQSISFLLRTGDAKSQCISDHNIDLVKPGYFGPGTLRVKLVICKYDAPGSKAAASYEWILPLKGQWCGNSKPIWHQGICNHPYNVVVSKFIQRAW